MPGLRIAVAQTKGVLYIGVNMSKVEMKLEKNWKDITDDVLIPDYKKPFYKEYREMVNEIEILPPCEQQTKVITMFHKFYNDMQENIEAQEGISEIQSTIIGALRQAAEMLIDLCENATIHIFEPSTLTIIELNAMYDRLINMGIGKNEH